MTSEGEGEAEYTQRQIRTVEPIRDYIRERQQDEEDFRTYSEHVDEMLPADWRSIEHGWSDDDIVFLKVDKEVDERINAITGGYVRKGEVLALYCLIDALARDDMESVEEIVPYLPELLWAHMEGRA